MLTAQLGDMVVVMASHQSVDPCHEPNMFFYTLMFRDLVTGQTAEVSYLGENNAVLAFAAWLASDEPNIGTLEGSLEHLRASLPKGFLP